MKKDKTIYWIFTTIFVLFDSGGALFFNTSFARDAIAHLGFPGYFAIELGLAKIIGGLVLVLPWFSPRIKEWAYVGFGISLVSAFIANIAVDGIAPAMFVVVVSIVFAFSYIYYHKIRGEKVFS